MNASSGGTIDLAAGTATTGDGSDTIATIANVFGTMFDDTILGTDWSNMIFGLNGNDVIRAGSAQDTIDGGDGSDQLYAEGGEDLVDGGAGDDLLSEIFENGFTAELTGGPGDDRYEIAFGSASGTIEVNEADDGGSDEIVVSCAAGGITDSPSGPGSGTVSRGSEAAPYAGIETVTIPAGCAAVPPAPPQPPPGSVAVAVPSAQPSVPESSPSESPAPEAEELGAVLVVAARLGARVRLDASATFLVHLGMTVDPRGWSWRVAGQRSALAGGRRPRSR